jgi:hypothetical protein
MRDGEAVDLSDRNRPSKLALLVKCSGGFFLLVGAVAAVMGPIETYCFYLFGPGGRFQYPGFGFGSLMFANVAVQIAGYYLIAAVFLPLGYGHLTLRRWARTLGEALLWCWVVVGVPLVVFFVLVLLQAKPITKGVLPLLGLSCFLLYPLIPAGLLYFYRRSDVREVFETRDTNRSVLEILPRAVLVQGILLVFFALVHHLPLLFNGLIPFFGAFLTANDGFLLSGFIIPGLVVLSAGVFARKRWAWWASILYLLLVGTSSVMTLSRVSFKNMIAMVNLPVIELQALQNVPLQSAHILIVIMMPLLLALLAFLRSHRDFASFRPDQAG